MFPLFDLFDGAIVIYTFWLTLSLCFFLYLWMLKKLAARYSYDYSFFIKNILYFFLGIFIFSRLFFVISKWNDLKFIKEPLEFFVMSDYNFSLFGWIFWFALVFYLLVQWKKEMIIRYMDGVVLSFLFVLVIGFVGAFFGGQVYGKQTNIGIELLYNHPFTPVPYQVPIFPLPVVYAILFFILFSFLYILSTFVRVRWFIGHVGMIAFGAIVLIFEFFSGKFDVFSQSIGVNMNQILALLLISGVSYSFYKLIKESVSEKGITILWHKE